MGGNHVHFEIDKDAGGRPAYAFTNCTDVSVGHFTIIQQGLCRVELFQYTKDPIVLLEGAKAGYPIVESSSSSSESPSESGEHSEEGTHPAPSEDPIQPISPSDPTLSGQSLLPVSSSLTLDFSEVDLVGKEFLNKWNIVVEKNFGEIISLDDELKFTVKITNKITGEFFHGTLSQPLLVIANNTNVSLLPVSTVLIVRGYAEINIVPKKLGNTYLALNLGTAKI